MPSIGNEKPKPSISVIRTSKTVKLKAVKKRARSFAIGAQSSSGGALSYKVVKANKRVTFKKGKATVKRGTKRGTYAIRVRVTSAASGAYAKGSQVFKITFRVK